MTLRTERLLLRRPAPKDWEGFAAFSASPRAAMAGGVLSRPDAWRRFAMHLAHWDLRGFGLWAVTMEDDTCLGMVGGFYPEGWAEREIGWILWAEAEGKGIGYEAARAARAHAYHRWGWDGAVSYINEANTRSRHLAERLGATLDPAAKHHFERDDVVVYRHPGPEALA